MQPLAYWIVKFMGDLFRMYITVGLNLAVFYSFELEFDYIWLPLLLYPWAVLPFTYVTTFIFHSTTLAQTITLFGNFVAMMLLSVTSYYMRLFESLEK